jgi:hypothetical protein
MAVVSQHRDGECALNRARPSCVKGPKRQKEKAMSGFEDIREHMEVIGADGVHIGTVDHTDGDRIKLTKKDSGEGHDHHHYISRGLVAEVEGDQVRLSATGANVAALFEEEKGGEPIG